MKLKAIALFFIVILLAACTPGPTELPQTVTPESTLEGWELVWSDEFDEETINSDNWVFDTGAGGWGNSEWQHYTDRSENARVEDGVLVIEALQEDYLGSDYTSARLKTQYLQTWTYGRVEARMKLPTGKGVWSAFWMLGDNFGTVGWPECGEIDIMENIGNPGIVYGTLHGPGYSGGNGVGTSHAPTGVNLSEDYHVYAIEWEPDEIRWYVDDDLFQERNDSDVPGTWVYDHPFFIILNLAIGGEWPGYPDESTVFPQQLLVDYVRVYRDPSLNLEALQGGKIHVADISMDLDEIDDSWEATAFVTIVDQEGNLVEDAVVTAGWLGVVTGATKDAVTGEDGVAGPFQATKTRSSNDVSFCISKVSAGSRYEYVKAENEITCVFLEP
jgi:beta-glucanase (GH16 family)